MNPVKIVCFVALLVATANASSQSKQWNQRSNSFKPTDWLSASQLESLSSVEDITLQQLENMPVNKGAELVQQLYHLAQINNDITPSFVPSANNIPAYIFKPNGQNVSIHLNQLVNKAKQQEKFGDEEVTIFITGLPQQTNSVRKATWKLVQAYQARYNRQQQQQKQNQQNNRNNKDNSAQSSSEEDYSDSWWESKSVRGNLVVIDLGRTLSTFKRYALLDVEQTGDMIGKVLVQLTNQVNVPQEIIHVVAQGIAAHVAGAAGRQYTRLTGHQLHRITALDPSKIFAKKPETLTGLARGDAQFVDAIHTSANGMGLQTRVGDVDFYPNGPDATVPGAENIIKAAMRATCYFAESVIPGNERNFPAVAARSLEEYKNNDGYGPRTYMGISASCDAEGDYILEVNPNAPFGKNAPAKKQNTYHHQHQPWRNAHKNSRENA